MISKAPIIAATVALLAIVSPDAQAQRPVTQDRPTAGWIGISFEISENQSTRATVVHITEVSHGSPAEIAGLRAGDRLLAINELDTPEELGSLTQRLHLSAGDRVVMQVERNGRRERIRLRATERPDDFTVGSSMEFSFEADSMVESWVRAMDSLRVQLVEGRTSTVRILRAAPGQSNERRVAPVNEGGRSVRAPFEFFIFRGEDHDSLRQEMVELNDVMSELELRLGERELAFAGGIGGFGEVHVEDDDEVRRLQLALAEADTRSTGLQAAMAEAARVTAGFEYSRMAPRVSSGGAPAALTRTEEFRPLTPYLLGRNRVAGAELVDLRPELAEYFKVEGGVLVVDVAPGTPAAIAGIVPGDVITRLDQVGVRSVEDLRFGVSRAGETLPVSLIRQGVSIQVLLRR